MDDEKIYVPPGVNLVLGYKIICDDEKCGRVGFEPTEEEAIKKRNTHLQAHIDHNNAVRHLLADMTAEADGREGGDAGPIPSLECPSCHVAIGFPHKGACDVAVCFSNGLQRILRDHKPQNDPTHECGQDVWSGYYSGEREALRYGVPVRVLKTLGQWCEQKLEWVLPEGWEQRMHERGLGPAIGGVM